MPTTTGTLPRWDSALLMENGAERLELVRV